LSTLTVFLINIYQRFISPYKGFRCAAGAYFGTATCSQAVKLIVAEDGLFGGRAKIRGQFRLCASAAQSIQEDRKKKKPKEKRRDIEGACWIAEISCYSCALWQ